MKNNKINLEAVLFDLDGTLIDTAPDMANAINQVLIEQNKEPLALDQIRPYVSKGSQGLIQLTFGVTPANDNYEHLKDRFLSIYKQNLSVNSKLFSGFEMLLSWMENAGIPWGIVTNKPGYLTEILINDLELSERAAVIVSGDTFSESKPSPLPLLESCKMIQVNPEACIYVGDDQRDIIAGNAANMTTVAALWGYIPVAENPEDWNSKFLAQDVADLTQKIQQFNTQKTNIS